MVVEAVVVVVSSVLSAQSLLQGASLSARMPLPQLTM